MDKLLCSCATHVIPEGYGVLNDLRNYRVCKKSMRVLGYGNVKGVDLEYFNPSRFKKTNIKSPFTFLFVGRIVRDKGINELVKAFADLYKKYKNTQLILVGNTEAGLDPISDATRQIISTCDAIKLCGPKYGEDLLQMYVDADCFVMPSYREGFPNVVIEAGAMGMPSIVTDVNGSREIIIEGENGFIVPPRTATILCEAMEKVLVDNELRESMRKKARMLIESRFEKSFVQRCLMEYYREIL